MRNLLIFIITATLFLSCSDNGSLSSSAGVRDFAATPSSFTFDVVTDADINTQYTSNAITITGLSEEEYSLFTVTEGTIIVNGKEQNSTTVTVDRNDSIVIKATSSSDYGITKSIEVGAGSYKTAFIIKTGEDRVPDTFSFNDISNADLSTTYTSNTITISGIGYGIYLDASVAGGKLYLNGVLQSDNNISVTNGDTVKLQATTESGYSKTTEAVFSVDGLEDTFSVTTYPSVTSVSLSPSASTIKIGSATVLTYIINPSNAPGGVLYSSQNPSVATVSSNGVVTGVAPGTALIKAASLADAAKYGTATVNVVTELPEETPTAITVTPALATLNIGETKTFDALSTPSGASSDKIWGSSDPLIAEVNGSGVVTAIAPGKVTIAAYDDSNMSINDSATVFVEIYDELILKSQKDTIGSVVDTCLDTNQTTLWVADSSPGIKSYSLNGYTLTKSGSLDVNGTTEAIELGRYNDDSYDFLYVADGYFGVKKLNITNTASPEINASYSSGYSFGNKSALDIAVSADESKIIVASKTGIEWLSVNGSTITSVDSVAIADSNVTSVELTSDDKIAAVAAGKSGVRFYGIEGSSITPLLGSYLTNSHVDANISDCNVTDIILSKDDKTAYIGCNTGLIEIIDFEDITDIQQKGTYKAPVEIESMKLSSDETKLYVGNGTLGIIVLDITFYDTIEQLTVPIAKSAFNTVGFVKDVEIRESNGITSLFVSDGGNGILILD